MKKLCCVALFTATFALVATVKAAPVSATSSATTIDTRTKTSDISNEAGEGLDTRTFTVDWSEPTSLNTKKIVGTMLLLR